MPHAARKQGSTGYYHIVPKGESDRLLFEDDRDRSRYLDELREACGEYPVRIHAYVLMSNHVHVVAESLTGSWDPIAQMMKRTDERYAMYFKEKSGRAGRVFKKYLWSEPIEDDGYLMSAIRYVHANPAVAGICAASAYRWSSVRVYLGADDGITSPEMALGLLNGRDGFIAFSREGTAHALAFPTSKLRQHLSDEEALTCQKG